MLCSRPRFAVRLLNTAFISHNCVRNIAYGNDNPRQVLDMYLPERPSVSCVDSTQPDAASVDISHVSACQPHLAPVVVFVHGGAWSWGHKWQYARVGRQFAKRGAVCAVVNYRVYPEGTNSTKKRKLNQALHNGPFLSNPFCYRLNSLILMNAHRVLCVACAALQAMWRT